MRHHRSCLWNVRKNGAHGPDKTATKSRVDTPYSCLQTFPKTFPMQPFASRPVRWKRSTQDAAQEDLGFPGVSNATIVGATEDQTGRGRRKKTSIRTWRLTFLPRT